MNERNALIGRALRWTWGFNAAAAAAQLALVCLIARFIAPADYGLMAAVAGAVRFALYFVDLGVSSAIIQKPDFDAESDGPIFFLISAGAGVCAALLVWVGAPWLAAWSAHPDSTMLIRLYGLTAVFAGAGQTGTALARRRMDFQGVCLWGFVAMLLGQGAVALPLAAAGFGVWSLLAGALTQTGVAAAFALRYAGTGVLRPIFPSRARMFELAGLSSRFLTLRLLDSAGLHLLPTIVFAVCGATEAGLWDRAFALTVLPLEMIAVGLGQVLFPIFSRLHDDPAARREAWLSGLVLNVCLTTAIASGMAAATTAIVAAALGGRWSDAAEPFFWLGLWGAARCPAFTCGSLLESAGRLRTRGKIQLAYLAALGGVFAYFAWFSGGSVRAADLARGLFVVETLAAAALSLPAAARVSGVPGGVLTAHVAAALAPGAIVAAAAGYGAEIGSSPAVSVVVAMSFSAAALIAATAAHPYAPFRRIMRTVLVPILRRRLAVIENGAPKVR